MNKPGPLKQRFSQAGNAAGSDDGESPATEFVFEFARGKDKSILRQFGLGFDHERRFHDRCGLAAPVGNVDSDFRRAAPMYADVEVDDQSWSLAQIAEHIQE